MGSACCTTPPTSQGDGDGEERPRHSPQEQRVSVARDSSKETQGNKCATNRWGGYLGKDAARQAGSRPPSQQAGRRQGAGAGTPRLRGDIGSCNGAKARQVCMPMSAGTASLRSQQGHLWGFVWRVPAGKQHGRAGSCWLTVCSPPSSSISNMPQISAFFGGPRKTPWGILIAAKPQSLTN